jgi:signal-transduction protein with cAMP-binding, CBS, and nucleotidyltransferase domain
MVIKTIKDVRLIPVIAVELDDTAVSVAKKLHCFQERRIFVVDKKKFPIGVISIVDINDRVVAKGKNPKTTKAKDIMSYPIKLVLDINTPLEEAKKRMIHNNNYYIPVVEKGKLKGLLNYSVILDTMRKENGKKS